MSNCPLCNSNYNNDDNGDELFLLHLTNFHGMQDDNAQDILGRSMESKASEDITFADGRDDDGYDIDGYDKDGYDNHGYNKRGSTRGYDKYGYNRYGYDRDGYDKSGVDYYGNDEYGQKKGESKINEVDFETMHNAEKWWDKEFVPFGSKTWENQNIAERRTTINAYLRRKQNAWGEKYIDEKHTGMTHYVDYGFTDNEWNLFSEDTKNSLRSQLRKNNESIANEWDCESCGGEYSNCPNCYEGVHDWEWEKENDVCPHCGKNRFGDEVNQLQTEEGMCKSCVDNFLSKAMEKYDNSGYDEDGYDEYGRDYDGKLKPSKNMTDLERSKDELLD